LKPLTWSNLGKPCAWICPVSTRSSTGRALAFSIGLGPSRRAVSLPCGFTCRRVAIWLDACPLLPGLPAVASQSLDGALRSCVAGKGRLGNLLMRQAPRLAGLIKPSFLFAPMPCEKEGKGSDNKGQGDPEGRQVTTRLPNYGLAEKDYSQHGDHNAHQVALEI